LTGQELKVLVLAQPCTARSLLFSADGKKLVAGCRGGSVVLWNVGTWKEQATFQDKQIQLRGVDLSRDGKLLAAGGPVIDADGVIGGHSEGMVRIWDVETGEERAVWRVKEFPNSVTFSPDGRFLAAAQHQSLVWDVELGVEVAVIGRPTLWSANSIRFSPNGKTLATANSQGVQFWEVSRLSAAKNAPD
jgi:WD40 repeat protein